MLIIHPEFFVCPTGCLYLGLNQKEIVVLSLKSYCFLKLGYTRAFVCIIESLKPVFAVLPFPIVKKLIQL